MCNICLSTGNEISSVEGSCNPISVSHQAYQFCWILSLPIDVDQTIQSLDSALNHNSKLHCHAMGGDVQLRFGILKLTEPASPWCQMTHTSMVRLRTRGMILVSHRDSVGLRCTGCTVRVVESGPVHVRCVEVPVRSYRHLPIQAPDHTRILVFQ